MLSELPSNPSNENNPNPIPPTNKDTNPLNEKREASKFKATISTKFFLDTLQSYFAKKPSLIEAFLTFSAIEVILSNTREKLWDQMSQNFPGDQEQLKEIKNNLSHVAKKIALDSKEKKLHPNRIWTPPEKGLSAWLNTPKFQFAHPLLKQLQSILEKYE